MMNSLLLVPVAVSIFLTYSPIVVLGQAAYLGKNAGFASGVTLGLTTIGGVLAPIVGWAAEQWGSSPHCKSFGSPAS